MADTTPALAPDPATTSNALSIMTATPAALPRPSAASRVASIPELLEKILLALAGQKSDCPFHTSRWGGCERDPFHTNTGLRTVLVSQRTCQTFRNTITGSIALQRALWLAPDNIPANADTIVSTGASDFINPFIDRTSRNLYTTWLEFKVGRGPWVFRYDFERPLDCADTTADRSESWRPMYICRGTVDGSDKKPWAFYRSGDSSPGAFYGRWENPTLGELLDSLHRDLTKGKENCCQDDSSKGADLDAITLVPEQQRVRGPSLFRLPRRVRKLWCSLCV